MRKSGTPRISKKKLLSIAGAFVLSVAVLITVTELTNRTFLFHDRKTTSGVIPSTVAAIPDDADSENPNSEGETDTPDQQPESPKEGDSSPEPTNTGAAPVAPYGNFVSNHSPNLDGSPNPSSMQSVCNTTSGAECTIEFRKDDIVKTLVSQKTNINGAAYWNWDIKSAELSTGTWKIKAIATLNGQTVSTEDGIDLEVGP